VFVKNLPYEAGEDEVGDYFSTCGEILEVRLVYHPVQKYFKGFGYVDFKTVSGAKNAVAMSGKMYRGRPLRIDSETRKPKNSYKQKLDNDGGNERYNKDKISGIVNKKISKQNKDDKYSSNKIHIKNYDPRAQKNHGNTENTGNDD